MPDLTQSAAVMLADRLAVHGFKKRSGGTFTTELEPDVLGVLGLNIASRYAAPGHFEVHPVVGVRH
jgi:hypothetical protein